MIDPSLLEMLVCPRTGERLEVAGGSLVSPSGARYPVVQGVPVMLRDDIDHTIGLAGASWRAAQAVANGEARGDLYFIETLGISDEEKQSLRALVARGETHVDPVASFLVGATNGIAYEHLIGKLADYPIPSIRLPPAQGETLLDIGCSWGRWSISAARQGYKPIGIDPSLGAVLAAKRLSKTLGLPGHFIVGDARYLPLRTESIDTAFSYSVIQHFARDSAARAVTEIGRVLKPGGHALVQMPTVYGVRCLYHLARRGFSDGENFDVRYWSRRDLRTLFQSVGVSDFSVDCYFGIGLQPTDLPIMPLTHRAAIRMSEALRRISRVFPPLAWLADSVYVESVKPKDSRV